MKINKKTVIILSAIILLGLFLRFYKLGNADLGFFRDEAALGLNAWSILKTGADEYGQKFPIVFRSFEVFFMPAYVYLSVPIFAVFGLNEFSARALAALSGTLLIPVSFLIANRLFKSKNIALVASFIVSISPWSIFYSRGAFEGNLALLFFAIGVYFWINFIDNKVRRNFFISILFFVLSMYSYQAPRFVAPVFVAISILMQNKWYKNIKLWVLGAIFAVILYIPIVFLTTSAAGYHRAFGVSIFSSNNSAGLNELASLYLHYFSPSNLFWNGDYNLQRNIPGFSTFYWWLLPFLFIGLGKVLSKDFTNKKILLLWLLIAPIPAALTRDPFHTYRSILFYLPITLIISYGIVAIYNKYKKLSGLMLLTLIGFSVISLSSFLFAYFKVAPVLRWSDWDYGYKEISEVINKQPENVRVVIDDDYTEAYVHFLYYKVISLTDYQNFVKQNISWNSYYSSLDTLRPEKFDRFEFRKVDWPGERGNENTLFIFPAKRLPPSEFATDPKLQLIHAVYAPNSEAAFYLIKR